MKKRPRYLSYLFFSFVISFFISSYSSATNLSGIVVFGDSLSDNGNMSNRIGRYVIPKFIFTVPNKKHYWEGRFSNGPIWAEYLADDLNLTLDDRAIGSAESYQDKIKIPLLYPTGLALSVPHQIQAYLSEHGKIIDSNKLYVVWIGGNDYMRSREQNPEFVVTNIINSLRTLHAAGGRNFLVINLPDLSSTPIVTSDLKHWDTATLRNIVSRHNSKLAQEINKFKEDLALSHVDLYNVDTLFREVQNTPHKFQISNISDRCYKGGFVFSWGDPVLMSDDSEEYYDYSFNTNASQKATLSSLAREISASPHLDYENYTCSDPDSYLFWDGLHPSAQIHKILGHRINEFLITKYGF